jgi:uncharacterized membrane protein
VYQFVVFLHILAAIVWVGGLVFFALVAVPVARRLPPVERAKLLADIGRRFRVVGWACLGVLVVTGLYNAYSRGVTREGIASGQFFREQFGQLLTAKVVLVGLMLVVTALHDFVVGPASTRATARGDAADPAEAAVLRRRASWLARLTTLLALIVVALAVLLVRGP